MAWVEKIEAKSVVVSEDWLEKYKEAPATGGHGSGRKGKAQPGSGPLVAFKLPRPTGTQFQITKRREALAKYAKRRAGLMDLFRQCATGAITSDDFYAQLPRYWSHDEGDRLQGAGWERQGKQSDFQLLGQSFIKIVEAPKKDRDDVVAAEIDHLHEHGVHARKAFFSEMLCLRFPAEYPVLNKPVIKYLKHVAFRAPRGATEGVRYVDLARKLRFSLLENPGHPAKTLAELDTVIWLKYHE